MTGSDVFSGLTPITMIPERVVYTAFQNETEVAKSKDGCHARLIRNDISHLLKQSSYGYANQPP